MLFFSYCLSQSPYFSSCRNTSYLLYALLAPISSLGVISTLLISPTALMASIMILLAIKVLSVIFISSTSFFTENPLSTVACPCDKTSKVFTTCQRLEYCC
ncbi:hypothetical protein CHS0354_012868 [Potamilus streckersoni]|uniref:Uncharacterized protein n=1 Tax=Potamilus streckersoni TaxID=2493646 RepID=A0AAE0SX89_9BIVA|nr:hypothetical protein CHS0354_012868 [Potamilus streckersoni]